MTENRSILTINGGSSSIKFALFEFGKPLERRLSGMIDRIGLSGTLLTFNEPARNPPESISLADSTSHRSAVYFLMDWLDEQDGLTSIEGVGDRVVHGMKHTQPELITQELLDELHRISPCDPQHLLERTHRKSATGFARSWGFLESTSKKSETQRMTP